VDDAELLLLGVVALRVPELLLAEDLRKVGVRLLLLVPLQLLQVHEDAEGSDDAESDKEVEEEGEDGGVVFADLVNGPVAS
jgi:hypothetical protein